LAGKNIYEIVSANFVSSGTKCITSVLNLAAIGKTVAEIWRFFDFSKMAAVRHLGFVMGVNWTTQKGNLVVFVAVQNLVRIDTVVSITCKF